MDRARREGSIFPAVPSPYTGENLDALADVFDGPDVKLSGLHGVTYVLAEHEVAHVLMGDDAALLAGQFSR